MKNLDWNPKRHQMIGLLFVSLFLMAFSVSQVKSQKSLMAQSIQGHDLLAQATVCYHKIISTGELIECSESGCVFSDGTYCSDQGCFNADGTPSDKPVSESDVDQTCLNADGTVKTFDGQTDIGTTSTDPSTVDTTSGDTNTTDPSSGTGTTDPYPLDPKNQEHR